MHESRSIGRRRVSMEARKSGGLRMGGQGRTSGASEEDVRTHPDTLHPGRRGLCARVSCSACCGFEHDLSQHIEKNVARRLSYPDDSPVGEL